MTTEIAVAGPRITGSALVIDPDQNYWTDRQMSVLHQLGVKDATPADLAVFFHQALRTGLDPFAKQIYMIGRKAKEGNSWVMKQTIQTGIDGFRLIARRAADRTRETLGYEDTEWCGKDGVWRDAWLADEPPAASRVVVLRNGQRYPATVHLVEYVQTYKDANGNQVPTSMWEKMVRNQLAKCAEAQALRKAFPQDLSGIYIDEEMPGQHADAPRRVRPQQQNRVTVEEIVGEPEPPAEEMEPDGTEPLHENQRKKMFALFNEAGIKDREVRLDFIRNIVQIDIASSNGLTANDAALVINALENPS